MVFFFFLISFEAFSVRFDVATILTADILRSPIDLRLSLEGTRICLEQTVYITSQSGEPSRATKPIQQEE